MKKSLLLGVALAALALCAPASAELKFKPGEDAHSTGRISTTLKKVDLKGETLTIFGPWRGEDEGAGPQRARLFHRRRPASRSNIPRRRTTSSRSSSTRRPAARPTSPSCRSPA